jgi:hypothetical protein
MKLTYVRRLVALISVVLAAAVLGSGPASAQSGADYISSSNVELVKQEKLLGDGVGARIVGNYLYATSTKDLEIFDISKPEDPQMVGSMVLNVEFENEEVPTNGNILGISGQTPTVNSGGVCPSMYPVTSNSGCLAIYDVRDKASPQLLKTVPEAGDHTSACALDCSFFYGSSGSVTDARGIFGAGHPAPRIGSWIDSPNIPDFNPKSSSKFVRDCHHVQEVSPGLLLAACQPFVLMRVTAADPLNPTVVATGANPDGRFIHGNHWPRAGADKFALVGGEHNFQPTCNPPPPPPGVKPIEIGAFMTWDASHVGVDGKFSGPLDEYRPTNGAYLDSNPPAQVLGCSVHWFDEHPTFKDGGLVALATYENGTRFLQVTPEGKIKEQGYFVPLGGSTSAPHWAPNSDIVYAIDYERGIDVLRYKGLHYVPGAPAEEGRTPGTADVPPSEGGGGPPAQSAGGASVCKASAGFTSADAHASGRGLKFAVSRRTHNPFDVEVVQQARGKRLVRNHAVKRFSGRTATFKWSGAGAKDGWYVVRFRMRLDGQASDVRRVSMRRVGGRFVKRPPSYLRNRCGALDAFKLQRPVFGGAKKRALKISYRLPRGVDSVKVTASAHGKVLRRFKGTGADAGRTYRLELPARGIRRGTDVRVRLTLVRAGTREGTTLVSRRL